MNCVGIDLGGSKISGVVVDKKMKILKRVRADIKEKTKEHISSKIIETISQVSSSVGTRKISSIGIGVPGSFRDGKIISLPNLPWMNGFELSKAVEKRFGIKTLIEKDANCFALGEAFLKKKQNMAGITIGTGLGGGIIIAGKLYRGQGNASEFGHIIVEHNGRKCRCGNRGCLEQYASSQGIEHDSRAIYCESLSAESLAEMARKGDRTALGIFENFGYYLGVGLASINYAINPDTIAIGGGLANAHDLFLGRAMEEMKRRSWIGIPKIYISKNDAALGAALVAARKLS